MIISYKIRWAFENVLEQFAVF